MKQLIIAMVCIMTTLPSFGELRFRVVSLFDFRNSFIIPIIKASAVMSRLDKTPPRRLLLLTAALGISEIWAVYAVAWLSVRLGNDDGLRQC